MVCNFHWLYNFIMYDTENQFESLEKSLSYIDEGQSLCLMCGQCCKIIVPPVSYERLLELAGQNEEEAIYFLNTFKKYETIDEARKVNEKHVNKIVEAMTANSQMKYEDISIYYCPHLSETNTCQIYSNRPNCCKRAPINGWALFPEGCGYEGWQFEERENIKTTIRKLKEQLYEIKILYSDSQDNLVKEKIAALEQKVYEKMRPYLKYGAENW